MTSFDTLGLAAPILKALAAEGYAEPTPIQAQAIPILLKGRDLVGLAQTGTGKTAAFALPILHRLNETRRHAGARGCRVLVLAPTRELAAQIADSFRAYGRFIGISTAVVFGGASMDKQRHAMSRGVDVLVATPGRLIDHIEQRSITLDKVEVLVLDEADHMLDIGFIHALKRIATLVPKTRQSVFFSATMPEPIADLAERFLTDPERVAVTPVSSTAERVEQRVIHIDHGKKADLLVSLVRDPAISRALVFMRTKHSADRLKRRLDDEGLSVEAIHGNKSQNQRERALEKFKRGEARLLIATEVAARGIDVDDVSHVINYDLPNVPEQYVHRIGRTARAGSSGMAISFCAPDERAFLRDIERLTKLQTPVIEHALSLPTPEPGDKIPPALKMGGGGGRQQPRQQRSSGPRSAPRAPYRSDRDSGGSSAPRAPREDRGEYRQEPRAPRRPEGRSEGRSEYRGDGRSDYSPEGRGDRAPQQRNDRNEPRAHGDAPRHGEQRRSFGAGGGPSSSARNGQKPFGKQNAAGYKGPKRDDQRPQNEARPQEARGGDEGMRRNRKGEEVWSNYAPAPRGRPPTSRKRSSAT